MMSPQTTRNLIITLVLLSLLGLVAYNGFFLGLGQIMRMISIHI